MAKPQPAGERKARLLAALAAAPQRGPRCPICMCPEVLAVWSDLREVANGMPARRAWSQIQRALQREAGLDKLSVNTVINHAKNHDADWRHKQ